jgi:hypothetical protein
MIPHAKAHKLLLSFLTREQEKSYLDYQGFSVIGEYTRNQYLLGYNRSTPVFTHSYSYCIHLVSGKYGNYYYPFEFPVEDHILAQKVMIETDELRFLKIACITRRRTGI